jgi:hypothetical protein
MAKAVSTRGKHETTVSRDYTKRPQRVLIPPSVHGKDTSHGSILCAMKTVGRTTAGSGQATYSTLKVPAEAAAATAAGVPFAVMPD